MKSNKQRQAPSLRDLRPPPSVEPGNRKQRGARQERSRDPGERRNKDEKLAEKSLQRSRRGLEASFKQTAAPEKEPSAEEQPESYFLPLVHSTTCLGFHLVTGSILYFSVQPLLWVPPPSRSGFQQGTDAQSSN
uniref:Uncharacterized protein n=1 Tax=Micrurus spixii TaxID=129469 RepID=A0A2D4NJZ3_9SAUR